VVIWVATGEAAINTECPFLSTGSLVEKGPKRLEGRLNHASRCSPSSRVFKNASPLATVIVVTLGLGKPSAKATHFA
jgi:hypothetical protein